MKPFLLTTVILVVSGIYPAIVDPVMRYFGDVSILPYQKMVRFTFDFTYTSTKTEQVTFYFDFSNTSYSNVNFYSHIVTLYNFSYTDYVAVPTPFLGEVSGTIRMRAVGDGFVTEKSFAISAIERATIDPLADTDNGTYSCSGRPVSINETGGLKYYSEKFTFHGFESVYESFAYHRLNFGNLIIHYDSDYNQSLLTYASASFYMKDSFNLFPNFTYDANTGFKYLNGQLIHIGNGDYSFSLSDKMYVDPTTLMMAISPNIGYVLTDFLYFPKNQFSKLQDIAFRITITNIGINEMTIDYSSNHYSDYRFFGDCVNSAYCVTVEDQPIDVGYEVSWEETTHG